jgi:large subunit ribosomal protein L17
MRHRKLNKRLGRNKSQRKQLMRSLVRGLFLSCKIETTLAKAKEARKLADRIIRYAKNGALKDIRAIESVIQDRLLTSKIVKTLAPLSGDRKGGYTRITRVNYRRGDGAQMAVLELTDMPVKKEKQKKTGKKDAGTADTNVPARGGIPKARQAQPAAKGMEREEPAQKEKKISLKSHPAKADEKKADKKKQGPKAEPSARPDKAQARQDKKNLFGNIKRFFKK